MKLSKIVQQILEPQKSTSELAHFFLDRETSYCRYAIGKNTETLNLHNLINLNGIIDDFSEPNTFWNGIPLIKTKDVNPSALIANCSTSISPIAVKNHLMKSRLENIISINELILESNGKLNWPEFVQSMRKETKEYLNLWQEIYDALFDEESRKTFLDVFKYRLTADSQYMKNYQVRIHDQYFEDFMNFKNEIFVDAGGFDGDTSEIFAQRHPDYRKILFIEPSMKNMVAARKRLAAFERIDFFPIGLSNTKARLSFNQDGGSASSVIDDGSETIDVDKLDQIVIEPVTFIKMDLEGWEIPALEGAQKRIMLDHPKLAIAVYHNSSDFRVIYTFIKKFNLNYRIYLRHYTQGWSETIMFFLPVK